MHECFKDHKKHFNDLFNDVLKVYYGIPSVCRDTLRVALFKSQKADDIWPKCFHVESFWTFPLFCRRQKRRSWVVLVRRWRAPNMNFCANISSLFYWNSTPVEFLKKFQKFDWEETLALHQDHLFQQERFATRTSKHGIKKETSKHSEMSKCRRRSHDEDCYKRASLPYFTKRFFLQRSL